MGLSFYKTSTVTSTKVITRVFVALFFICLIIYFSFSELYSSKQKNVVLIGWDGTEREVVYNLLETGKLPNLREIVDQGSLVSMRVTAGKTVTKPGWTEILTGYKSATFEVLSNAEYKPIPVGHTVFERLKDYHGVSGIVTTFITGKINNLGARGPHKVCINCIARDSVTFEKTEWWDETSEAPLKKGQTERIFEEREGEPFYYTKEKLDFYASGLGAAPNVGKVALGLIEKYKNDRFFMFFHFEEPDEPGHVFGGNSEEYQRGLIEVDFWLGEIVAELRKHNIYDNTLIYITSDHGFNSHGKEHNHQPKTFFATNDSKKMKDSGDRLDVTPTILRGLGLDFKNILPPFDGEVLYE